jgi:hypothetical protein
MGGALWRYGTQKEGCTNHSFIHSYLFFIRSVVELMVGVLAHVSANRPPTHHTLNTLSKELAHGCWQLSFLVVPAVTPLVIKVSNFGKVKPHLWSSNTCSTSLWARARTASSLSQHRLPSALQSEHSRMRVLKPVTLSRCEVIDGRKL